MEFPRPASLAMPFLTLTAHPTIGAVLLDSRPAWVWNGEGNRILWSNAAGLDFFDETSMDKLLKRSFGDVHPARRHLARLARNARSNAPMLERLRFFLGTSAVTSNCLCKRLEVEGEAVLLVIATDSPAFGKDDADRSHALLTALSAEEDIAAACLDNQRSPIATAGGIDAVLSDQSLLDQLISAADTPLRLVSMPIGVKNKGDETGPMAALVRVGEGEHARYLLMQHEPQSEADRKAEDHALLMADLGDSTTAETEQTAIHEGADIFAATFGMSDASERADHLTSEIQKADQEKDTNLAPFRMDETAGKPEGVPKTKPSANIYALPTATDRLSGASKNESKSKTEGDATRIDATKPNLADQLDKGGVYHFVWESDEVGRFNYVSKDLAKAVGSDHAAIIGKSWPELATSLGMDSTGIIADAFESRDTWVGLKVLWPVQGQSQSVEVELTGLPIFGRYHGFKGFRGFGMCNTKIDHTGEREGDSLQSASSLHAPDTALPQFHDNNEILSDELLQAVNHAVAAAESLISPEGPKDTVQAVSSQGENGARAMSDDQNEFGGTDLTRPNDGVGASPILGSANGDDQKPSDIASTSDANQTGDPYHRVKDLLTEEAHGVKAFEPSQNSSEQSADDEDSNTLSVGEQDAFDEIAAALGAPGFEETLPKEDIDEDFEDFEDPLDLIEDEADDTDDAPAQQPITTVASKFSKHRSQDTDLNIDQSRLQKVLNTRSNGDETLKSAASSAFREIFAMDPAFRHMRERLAQNASSSERQDPAQSEQMREHQKLLDAVQALADGEDLHATETSSDTSDDASTEPTTESQADTPTTDDAEVGHIVENIEVAPTPLIVEEAAEAPAMDAETDLEPVVEAEEIDLPEATQEELDEEIADLERLDGASESKQDEASSDPDVHRPEEKSSALATVASASVAGLIGANLWDREDANSPLIDLLNKVQTAMLVSAEGRILFASRKALDLLGFETEQALETAGGMEGLFSGRPGDWLTKTEGRTTLKGAKGAPISVQARISSVNWGDRPAALLTFEEAPEEPAKVGISEEDEKIAELEAILDTATDGVIVMDGDGNILRMNHSAEALFEVDRHDVAGSSFLDLLAEESHKDAFEYLETLRQNGLASVLNDGRDIIGVVASGGLIPLHMTMGRVNIPGTNRFCAVLRDNAEYKRSEEELLTEKMLAENANKQKSEFLAKVSHEIRTPLNAIIGFAEVMMEERFGPVGVDRYKDYLKDIKTSGNHIMSLINDLLDLSKVEAGKMEMQFEATHLNRLVSESVGLMQQQANRQHIIIRTSLASELPDIAGDKRSLRQIVLNLLSNAVKFTHAGGQVILSTVKEDNGDVVLRIRDTGIGMSEKDLETALEPFRQVSAVRDSSQGTGLGLPLTKALVEANRGRLELKSKPGEGTLAEVTFPSERVVEPQD